MSQPVFIMVLNDGETYTDMGGCRIIQVWHDDPDEIETVLAKLGNNTAYHSGGPQQAHVIREFSSVPREGDWM